MPRPALKVLAVLLLLVVLAVDKNSFGAGPVAPPPHDAGLVQRAGKDAYQLGGIKLDPSRRALTFPATLHLLDQILEYALVTEEGKTHESLLTTQVVPRELHLALLLLNAKPSSNLGQTNQPIALPPPAALKIELEWQESGNTRTLRLDQCFGLAERTSLSITSSMPQKVWLYNGSLLEAGRFIANEEGSIISLIRDPAALINNPGIDRDDDDIHVADRTKLPAKGTKVLVRITCSTP